MIPKNTDRFLDNFPYADQIHALIAEIIFIFEKSERYSNGFGLIGRQMENVGKMINFFGVTRHFLKLQKIA